MSNDLRKYARQTQIQLIVGGIIMLFVVGLGLIAAFYGIEAALLGLVCLLGAFLPISASVLLLGGLDILLKFLNRDR
jgi:glutamate-1-semialdehyde aminotransferase